MTDYWKQWEGQVIDDAFPLQQYLSGDEDHAVFLTESGQAIQIVPDLIAGCIWLYSLSQ